MDRKTKNILSIFFIALTLIFGGFAFYLAYVQQTSNFDRRTDAEDPNAIVMSVNPSRTRGTFSPKMRGIALAPWEHSWGRPFLGNVNGIRPVLQQIKPGIIRYSGGLWINNGSFVPGLNQVRPNEQASGQELNSAIRSRYPNDNNTYGWNYGIDEIDSLGVLARELGAEVMVQVNIVNNNPQMWADMVSYVRSKNYPFTYWELGNELDLTNWEGKTNINADEYARRVVEYNRALKATNPNIKVVSGVPAFGIAPDWLNQGDSGKDISPFIKKSYDASVVAGDPVESVSYHWYQRGNNEKKDILADITKYRFIENGLAIDPRVWNNTYSRIWGDQGPQRIRNESLGGNQNVEIGVTELNVDSFSDGSNINQNHIGAVWQADMLGRLAYNGISYAMIWMGYNDGPYGLITHDDGNNLRLQSTYYTSYMYNKYFGDTLLESSTADIENTAIWASTDSDDPGKIKLMLINYNTSPTPLRVNLGTNVSTGLVYELTSTEPVTSGTNINSTSLNSRINGVELTPQNIASVNIPAENINVNGSTLNYSAPAFSVSSIVLNADGRTLPTSTSTTTITNNPTATATTTVTTTTTVTATSTTTVTTTNAGNPTQTRVPTATQTTRPTGQSSPTTSITNTSLPTGTSTTSTGFPTTTPTGNLPNTSSERVITWLLALGGLALIIGGLGFVTILIIRRRKRDLQ